MGGKGRDMDPSDHKPILILGVGNILLRDEGIGVRVIEALAGRELDQRIEVLDGGTSGADLVEQIAGRRLLLVVDAMQGDHPPGTVIRLSGREMIERTEGTISLHEFGLAETLLMARGLGCEPAETVIFGVQPAVVEPGLELSAELAGLVERLADLLVREAEAALR